jgi:hypothetical protein
MNGNANARRPFDLALEVSRIIRNLAQYFQFLSILAFMDGFFSFGSKMFEILGL